VTRVLVGLAALAVLAVIGLSLAGCADRHENDIAWCRYYGFRPGTDAYANCLMSRDMAFNRAIGDWANSMAIQNAITTNRTMCGMGMC
jgi:uncharacterized lipoprotein NlpE involved in copper resistance